MLTTLSAQQFDADKKNNSGGKKKSIGIHCVAGLGRYGILCVNRLSQRAVDQSLQNLLHDAV